VYRSREASDVVDIVYGWLINSGATDEVAAYTSNAIVIVSIVVLGLIAHAVTKKIILRFVAQWIRSNRFRLDNVFLERNVFDHLANLVPGMFVFSFAGLVPEHYVVIQRFSLGYMILVGIFSMSAFLDAIEDIYNTFEVAKVRPIKSIVQVAKIFVYILGGIWLISTIIDRSPLILLSGIGALTAVFMLVFQDSLLGLVGSIQLSANDMVRIGDWIEMPKYGADGDVIDVSLNTVKVRNWDKTITTIPTYALIRDSFKNWRGMREAGGRRIKRSVYIDITSIKFCTEEMLKRFEKIQYISEYIKKKNIEIEEYNQEHEVDPSQVVNGRRLTNIGTFRAYLQAYLQNHPGVHKGMIYMVRHLPPGDFGLPIEIYAFTNDTAWVKYESIQADIFDHVLAVIPEFDLRIHQSPTGHDISRIGDNVVLMHRET
jgi:miniconductance mechanosensitive channel